jgi:hypothetical protein
MKARKGSINCFRSSMNMPTSFTAILRQFNQFWSCTSANLIWDPRRLDHSCTLWIGGLHFILFCNFHDVKHLFILMH